MVSSEILSAARVTLFAGHYGSGKTNIAINYARALRRTGAGVTLADLDIVNPYFRTKDSAAELQSEGIDLVVSDFANSNVDFPALPKEIYGLVAGEEKVVMDVGGDDRGALALGRWAPDIRAAGDYEMLGVVNAARPLTRTAADTVAVLREIEAAGGIPFTGIVNNTNVGPATTVETILSSLDYAREVAAQMKLSVRFTCAEASVASELDGRIEKLFPIKVQRLYYQLNSQGT